MTAHLVTSHGADFFGEDRYSLVVLAQIAEYVRGSHPAVVADPLGRLLDTAGAAPQEIPPARAAEIGEQLLATARGRFTGEPWVWTPAA